MQRYEIATSTCRGECSYVEPGRSRLRGATVIGVTVHNPAVPVAPRWTMLHALAAAADFERYFRWRRAHDSDPFVIHFPGFDHVLFTGHPEGAHDVFRTQRTQLEPPLPNPIAPMVGDASLILASGEEHRRQRALLLPPFHAARMHTYAEMIREAALHSVSTWQPGMRIDSRAVSREITLRVILGVVFGISPERTSADDYIPVVRDFLDAYGGMLLLVPKSRFGFFGLAPWDRFLAARARLDDALLGEIAARRAAGPGDDVLSMLLASRYDDGTVLEDSAVVDQLRTLLVAGHETTATSVVWILFHLLREPEIRQRVLDEIAALGPDPAAEQLARLPYLTAVCEESMRLHPPVPIVLRRVVDSAAARAHPDAVQVRGVPVAPGATMAVSVSLLHQHPDVWSNPQRFDPDRFLGRKYAPHEFAPFGGGHRRCIGYALAEYEMRIVVATVLSTAELALRPRDLRRLPKSVPHNIAAGPRRPIRFDVVKVRY